MRKEDKRMMDATKLSLALGNDDADDGLAGDPCMLPSLFSYCSAAASFLTFRYGRGRQRVWFGRRCSDGVGLGLGGSRVWD